MDRMEMVEALRERAGCSYVEAKAALEETGDDLLEALCWLESHGKTQIVGASCSTADREPPKAEPEAESKPKEDGPFVRGCKDLWQGITDLFRWANRNELVMKNRRGEKELGIPLTIVAVILILAFWVALALVVVVVSPRLATPATLLRLRLIVSPACAASSKPSSYSGAVKLSVNPFLVLPLM